MLLPLTKRLSSQLGFLVFILCLLIFVSTVRPPATTIIRRNPSGPRGKPRWLLAIFTAPFAASRRDVIRTTWLRKYNHTDFDYRFILGSYRQSDLAPAITAENTTHGDIWELDEFTNENYQTANSIKNMELFKYMAQKYNGTQPYDFVSKVDDDIWFNIPPYYKTFMAPRLPGGRKHDPNALVMIGRPMVWGSPYAYASGRLYTLSWSLLEFFAKKYTAEPYLELTEDKMAGHFLYHESAPHEFDVVELEQAWDIGLERVVSEDVETMLIHSIKHDERIAQVGEVFDDNGKWNGKLMDGLTSFNRTMPEVIERIGPPSGDEMAQLNRGWSTGTFQNTWNSLDWKLIDAKIAIENREKMGTMYPLNLPGNNKSTGIVARPHRIFDDDRMS